MVGADVKSEVGELEDDLRGVFSWQLRKDFTDVV